MGVTVRELKRWIDLCGLDDDSIVYIETADNALDLAHAITSKPGEERPGYFYLEVGDDAFTAEGSGK
jgi:hypothetical protein